MAKLGRAMQGMARLGLFNKMKEKTKDQVGFVDERLEEALVDLTSQVNNYVRELANLKDEVKDLRTELENFRECFTKLVFKLKDGGVLK